MEEDIANLVNHYTLFMFRSPPSELICAARAARFEPYERKNRRLLSCHYHPHQFSLKSMAAKAVDETGDSKWVQAQSVGRREQTCG